MIKFVCCFWNAENYIKNCIRTLKSQKDTEFEVYLIDDMSTDNGAELVKKLIDGDKRFKFITNTEKKFKLKNLDELISTLILKSTK
jgi:glycosyltransferase involved in cell wall biosynthesis